MKFPRRVNYLLLAPQPPAIFTIQPNYFPVRFHRQPTGDNTLGVQVRDFGS